MSLIDESSTFIANNIILLSVVLLICFFITLAFISTSFKLSDLKNYEFKHMCCKCCTKKVLPQSLPPPMEENPRINDHNNFIDIGDIGEVIDFTLQTNSSQNTDAPVPVARNHLVPKSLKIDPLLCFDRRNLHFTETGIQGKYGIVSRGKLTDPDGSQRDIVIRSLGDNQKSNVEIQDFFEDLIKFHELKNDNVLKLLGIDYAQSPFLAIFDDGNLSDLKSFLLNIDEPDKPFNKELLLSFCHDIASGLKSWHQNFTIPLDFGTRTCQVTSFLTIKIGDIGDALSLYPEDYVDIYELISTKPDSSRIERYYPIRWLSPEILKGLKNGKISTFVTRQNSIWSLGATFWEMLTFGNQPFPQLSNRQVLFGETRSKLEASMAVDNTTITYIEEKVIFDVMMKCFKMDPADRSDIFAIHNFLTNIMNIRPEERHANYITTWDSAFFQSDSGSEL
ncbi:LMTK2 [Lepeophtheirus salmonis]|uniref:LMTK2 n=2 Tax=Lepeophtheirus salmonis TaxID=72036 RepID=A0A7R8H7X4_LEPSM|nr:LMTK2 [Lepeophtheirus salmonis]CAF2930391.1 LMTK2 [Lepeophtheirus salmonis]